MIKKVINKLKGMFTKYIIDKKNFGKKIAKINFLYGLSNISSLKINNISNKKHKLIKKFLESNFNYIIEKYKNNPKVTEKKEHIIWCFWYQGIDNAPLIVKKCIYRIKSLIKNSNENI